MTETQAKQEEQNREFALQRIYTKDLSFETPNSPAIFQQEWKPETGVNLNTEVSKLSDEVFEVTLTVTVTTKIGDQTAYLAEVKQAGIFSAKGFSEPEMGPLLGAYCPNQLFPYVRETIADLVMKGSFPQMVMQPVNFDMLYAQHHQQQVQQAQQAQQNEPKH
jgi:preprotein translocase subunit SecB